MNATFFQQRKSLRTIPMSQHEFNPCGLNVAREYRDARVTPRYQDPIPESAIRLKDLHTRFAVASWPLCYDRIRGGKYQETAEGAEAISFLSS